MNQNEIYNLTGKVEDMMGDLRVAITQEFKRLRDERDSALVQLTKVSNELDLVRKASNVDLREAYDRLKREAEGAEQRHKDEMKAARAENAKLREAKNEAFRRLTNQNILLEKIRGLQEANLQLLRERDALKMERNGHQEQAGQLLMENQRLQRELTAQEQENDRITEANLIKTPSEQRPWLIYDAEDDDFGGKGRWRSRWEEAIPFETEAEAWAEIANFTPTVQRVMRVVALAEAAVISRTMKEGAK